ncbi:MAG: hypothetical protein F9K46_00095 [Anaerolineae bacterium]|nr:MAG: hypothetical protein F9K46_00095 [Anaerolineae bacterium]
MLDQLLDTARPALYHDLLSEALGQHLPPLNEPGWTPLGSSNPVGFMGLSRRQINDEVRHYYHSDPTLHYMVELENAYTFSRGVSVKAKDPDIDAWLQRFWRHPSNRASLTTAKAQWELNKELQLEGELFFILYTSTLTGQVTVRNLPPQQVVQVIPAKGDAQLQQYYLADFTSPQQRTERYPLLDYRVADTKRQLSQPDFVGSNTEVAILHVLSDAVGGRGLSPKRTSIRWVKALTGFMQDRAVLTLAGSTFAFKHKIKGNRQALELALARWGAYEAQLKYGTEGHERRQGGNTFLENEAANLEQLKFDTMAANAYQDMRMFRQLAGIGSGVFEHYLGDPSTGNLATATAMELPMLKLFEFRQQFWADVLSDLLHYVLLQGLRYGRLGRKAQVEVDQSGGYPMWVVEPQAGTDLTLDVIFPPIVQKDVAVQASALAQVATAEATTGQQMLPPEKKAEVAINLFGGDKDSGALIEEMKANDFALPNRPTPQPSVAAETANDEPTAESAALHEVTGSPLPKAAAEAVPRITKQEVNQALDDWLDLPPLDELLAELGVSREDVDA